MVLWKKNNGTMEKSMLLCGKTMIPIPKTIKLWFTMGKNYGTMEKTMVLWKKTMVL